MSCNKQLIYILRSVANVAPWKWKKELLSVQLSKMQELILQKGGFVHEWVRESVYSVKWILGTSSEREDGVGNELQTREEEKTTLLVVRRADLGGACGWYLMGGSDSRMRRAKAAMLDFSENECHSVSFRCQASCRELCASLKGDSKETEPLCCCHSHSASRSPDSGHPALQAARPELLTVSFSFCM